jgi:ATP-dependent DNA helicase RecQ
MDKQTLDNAIHYGLCSINTKRNTSYCALKSEQAECLQHLLLSNSDVLAVLPTGFGKSIIFELIPYCHSFLYPTRSCTVLVVVPLNAIISEQKARYGSDCVVISNELIAKLSVRDCLEDDVIKLRNGTVMFIIGHPEVMLSKGMMELFKTWRNMDVYIVIDEAHVTIQWGESGFRSDYSQLYRLKSLNCGSKFLALTATASIKMQAQIATSLLMQDVRVVVATVNRSNIYLSVKRKDASTGQGHSAEDSFLNIVEPLFDDLEKLGEAFPKTVLYCKLFWCGMAYEQAVMRKVSHHVAMYHAMCTAEVTV